MPQNRITPCLSLVTGISEMALTLPGSVSAPCSDSTCPMKVIFDNLN